MSTTIRRVCKKCQEVKNIDDFAKTKNRTHLAHRYICIICEKEKKKQYNKKYYLKKKKIKKDDDISNTL